MSKTFSTHVSLDEKARKRLIDLFNGQLANAIDLWTQLKQAHWNVRGRFFIARHELFDALAATLDGHADELAERVATLGGYAEGTARLVSHNSTLTEYDLGASTGQQHVIALVERYAAHASTLRLGIKTCEEVDDPASADILVEQLRAVEKDMWFLESHLHE